MSAARFVEPYLAGPSIQVLLSLLNATSNALPIDQLRSDFHALHPGGRAQFEATLRLMEAIGLLKSRPIDEFANAERAFEHKSDLSLQSFAHVLLEWLLAESLIGGFVEALQLENEKLVLDNMGAPWRLNQLRHLLRELGVFSREDVNDRHWLVGPEYFEYFVGAAQEEALDLAPKAPLSPEALQRINDQRALLGEQAEEWALSYERKRLAKHPLCSLIRRISLTDVSAGYDILSFATMGSLTHDRFLEIKSVSDPFRFFWSAGEVETAKSCRDKYVLMLIDRERLSDPSYSPIEIADPYSYFFDVASDGWSINSSEWMIERK